MNADPKRTFWINKSDTVLKMVASALKLTALNSYLVLSRQCWATSALTSVVSNCKLFLTSLLLHYYYNKLFNSSCLIYSKTYIVHDPRLRKNTSQLRIKLWATLLLVFFLLRNNL